ncbi:hypothetical protein [Thioalkalivibrio sp. XN8]|nr:hypothetical protein [Thioalkalivibrio sp. XN8]
MSEKLATLLSLLRVTVEVAQGLERHLPGERDKDFPSEAGR